MGNSDQRHFPRIGKICFTAVKKYNETGELEEGLTGETLNISEGGILLLTENPLPFLAKLDVVIGLANDMLKIKGEVAHLKKLDNGKIEMGIKFVKLSEYEKKALLEAL
jgi:c-di-GMP-binding flagellar brake protein YcgR